MKKILIFIVALVFIYGYNTYYPLWLVKGVYVSSAKEPIGEGPKLGDTLNILEDFTFQSEAWGNGAFKLKHSWRGTRIVLSYNENGYNAAYDSYFTRTLFFGKPKVGVFSDLNYHFENNKNVCQHYTMPITELPQHKLN